LKRKTYVDEDFELWTLLHQARDTIAKAREKELRELGVSSVQAATLWVIRAIDGPATPAEISRWLFREPNTVFVLLKHLEKKGLVTRVKDLERKNMVRIEITRKGVEISRKAMARKASFCDIFSGLSQEEHAALRTSLWKLRDRALVSLGVRHQLPHP
jgi:DNA-binding MarR family transcriptional regulator